MTGFLDRMAASSRERVRTARAREAMSSIMSSALAAAEPLPLGLSGFDLIAELKLRSPAAGPLADTDFDAGRQLDAYANAGAAAVSVLTEPDEFLGRLEHLRDAAAALRKRGCPVMRKDFLVDVYQIAEARAAGASGVLLIAAMLSDGQLDELLAAARELGLFVLLEAFDADDLARIARIDAPGNGQLLVGVNSRDLRTLDVDNGRFAALVAEIRSDLPAVAESGIECEQDIETVAELGFSLALVGSALMRDGQAEQTAARFIAAGRAAAGKRVRCS